MQQGTQQLAEQDQGQGHCARGDQHLALHRRLADVSSDAVVSANGASASLGPMPISSIRNVPIALAAVTEL